MDLWGKKRMHSLKMPWMNERKVWYSVKKTEDAEEQKLLRGLMRYMYVLLVAVLERNTIMNTGTLSAQD